ncbi:MAG: hypothetical protein IKU10_06260 [Clostridia bacterium]|nr:hypothetical protein [Clostridia bacterium]
MKKAVKVFVIIGMILGFWTILPLIFGSITLKKLNNNIPLTAGNKVCILLFVSVIAGILAFCMPAEQA